MDQKLSARLKSEIERGLEALECPGVAVAIVRDDQLILCQGYGWANLDTREAMTGDHILPIGSTGKALAAASVAILAGEGALDLDAPVKAYIPGFEMHDPVATAQVTPRDMLCHRTGLAPHNFLWHNITHLTGRDLVQNRLRHLPGNRPFRSAWEYNNHMYLTCGHLIEAVTGKTYEAFLEERILAPLGIKARFKAPYPYREGYARLYQPDADGRHQEMIPHDFSTLGPMGSPNATVREMANWVRLNLNGGVFEGKTIIPPAVFPELHRPIIPHNNTHLPPEAQIMGYALGWSVESWRGMKHVYHGGNVLGGSTQISFLPEQRLGCVILTNGGFSMLRDALPYVIYDRLLGIDTGRDWIEYFAAEARRYDEQVASDIAAFHGKSTGAAITHPVEDYLGVYHHPGYGDVTIGHGEGGFTLTHGDRAHPLKHHHYDMFSFIMAGLLLPVSFITGAGGGFERADIGFEPSLPPMPFVRTTPQ